MTTQQVRSIFLSDIHLGTKACQAGHLLSFLKEYSAEYVFLLGDIVDLWSMKRGGVHWSPEQNTVVQKMLRRSRNGEKVIFIPGNHDEAIREYAGSSFGDVMVMQEYIHTAADGRKYLLLHGDEFDQVTLHHKWVAVLGDMAYNVLVNLNVYLSWLRRTLKVTGYWSLAGYAKRKIKTAVNFIFDFEDSVLHHARERGVDGAICGHIHWPMIKNIDGMTYLNCGDWVDSCTAIVEHLDGRMELIYWKGTVESSLREGAVAPNIRKSEDSRQPQLASSNYLTR
jgi:UDP-2,3-diacylglucosamine pyrophosphatase LpxH